MTVLVEILAGVWIVVLVAAVALMFWVAWRDTHTGQLGELVDLDTYRHGA